VVTFEKVADELAAGQHGVVTRAQLQEAGVPLHVIEHRVRTRRVRPLHRGVYLIGPVLPPEARAMAAALACGTGAAVGHRTAAGLHRFAGDAGTRAPVEVVVPRGHPRRMSGIRVHRTGSLRLAEVTAVRGIPVTTPARTLWDLAIGRTSREFERWLAAALDVGVTTVRELLDFADHRPRSPASLRLRAVLGRGGTPALTRSEAEERLMQLLKQAKLPGAVANVVVHGHEVDFYWPAARLVVEVDGYAFHGSRVRFEADRRRDSELIAAGLRVMRVTWRQITEEPLATVVRIARALGPDREPQRSMKLG
jgi:very-short-patch-repair endonuclease